MPFHLNPRAKAFTWLMLSFSLMEPRQRRTRAGTGSFGGAPEQLYIIGYVGS